MGSLEKVLDSVKVLCTERLPLIKTLEKIKPSDLSPCEASGTIRWDSGCEEEREGTEFLKRFRERGPGNGEMSGVVGRTCEYNYK